MQIWAICSEENISTVNMSKFTKAKREKYEYMCIYEFVIDPVALVIYKYIYVHAHITLQDWSIYIVRKYIQLSCDP